MTLGCAARNSASRAAFRQCCCILSFNVCRLLCTNQASKGLVTAPKSACSGRILPMSSFEPIIAPAVTSECPFKYFVRLSITRSAPHSLGRQSTGLAKVLSTISGMPKPRLTAARRDKSATFIRGLEIVSTKISLVLGRMASSTLATFSASTKVTSMPHLLKSR
ncbi:MAG: hypothetical protein DDT38_01017 [Firmicutes bacterium]|nr:hypothetical protein [candidate division NPL-UPA2 bacterium]